MSRKLLSRLSRWPRRRRRPAAATADIVVQRPRRSRPIIYGRAWQTKHSQAKRRRAEKIDALLHWICCVAVPAAFVLSAWLFCIYRLAKRILRM